MNNRERIFYITLLLIQAFFVFHIYKKASNIFSKADSLQIFILSTRKINSSLIPEILLEEKDIEQFGFKFPSIYLVNGKGEILLNISGFDDNDRFKNALIEAIWTAYKKDRFRKAERIVLNNQPPDIIFKNTIFHNVFIYFCNFFS